ncbi:MAG: hypothetical protein ACK2UK_19300 [Candidatus Promineifilaceae bacterium]
MRAVVHIGTEKTGTTTIQNFLHLNREALQKQGVAYLRSPGPVKNRDLATFCMDEDSVDEHVFTLGIVSAKKRRKWKAAFKRAFEREIRAVGPDIHTVIFSAEFFQSRLRTENEVRTLQRLLSPYFETITILVYLRRQDQFAVSFYSTLCRSGSTQPDVLKAINGPDEAYAHQFEREYYSLNYYGLVEKWARVFGRENIVVRIFERGRLRNGDVLDDFREVSGIVDTPAFVYPQRLNESLSAEMQNALLLFNRCFPTYLDPDTRVSRHIALRDYLISRLEGKYAGPERKPSRAEALAFYDMFAASNQRLAREYLGSVELFTQDFSDYGERPTGKEPISEALFADMLLAIGEFMEQEQAPASPAAFLRRSALRLEQRIETVPAGIEQRAYRFLLWLLTSSGLARG